MAQDSKWLYQDYDMGVQQIELSSWKHFMELVNDDFLDYSTSVYRGHGDSTWKLEPTIDRVIKDPLSNERQELLNNFKYAVRGRRGANPPQLKSDNDWWALGQHHGLCTPLLDFFAATKAIQIESKYCTIWALSQYSIDENNIMIRANNHVERVNNHKPTVKIVRPLSDENARLVNQRGLFTRGPNNQDIESWIKTFHPGGGRGIELYKVNVPNKDLNSCLRYLNKMNINYSTLFPDISGAAAFCNYKLRIESY
jgi:hypothetical protein